MMFLSHKTKLISWELISWQVDLVTLSPLHLPSQVITLANEVPKTATRMLPIREVSLKHPLKLILEYSQFQTPPCFTILISSQLKIPLTIIVLWQFVIPHVHLYEHKKLTHENFVMRNILTWSALQYIQHFNKYHVYSPNWPIVVEKR